MYERFTDRARKVMQLANQEAHRLNHEYVGTEHILLGLVKEETGIAAKFLKQVGIDLAKVRLEVVTIVKWGPANMVAPGKLPQTPRVRTVIAYAIEEARNLVRNHVGTEHLLLGLLREPEGVAAKVLLNLGLRLDQLRDAVLITIKSPSYHQEGAPSTPALAAQRLAPDASADQNIQRAQDVAHLQDQLSPQLSDAGLSLDLPDLEGLISRPGVLGRVWNILLGRLGGNKGERRSYEEPPEAGRYTARARLVLYWACDEARRMNHEHIGTEHVLLGLLNEGTAARILENLGIDRLHVRSELFRLVQFGPELMRVIDPMPWTPRSMRILEYACAEADRDRDGFVRPEHLLLGTICEEEGVAGHVLLSLGLTRERMRAEVERMRESPV